MMLPINKRQNKSKFAICTHARKDTENLKKRRPAPFLHDLAGKRPNRFFILH